MHSALASLPRLGSFLLFFVDPFTIFGQFEIIRPNIKMQKSVGFMCKRTSSVARARQITIAWQPSQAALSGSPARLANPTSQLIGISAKLYSDFMTFVTQIH